MTVTLEFELRVDMRSNSRVSKDLDFFILNQENVNNHPRVETQVNSALKEIIVTIVATFLSLTNFEHLHNVN